MHYERADVFMTLQVYGRGGFRTCDLERGNHVSAAQPASSSLPWRRMISAMFSGGTTLGGGTVGVQIAR